MGKQYLKPKAASKPNPGKGTYAEVLQRAGPAADDKRKNDGRKKKKVDRPCKGHRALQKGKSLKKGKRKTAKGSSTGTLHPVNCLWKKWQGSGLELVGFGLQLVCSSLSILGS